jgi:hypothetical protein
MRSAYHLFLVIITCLVGTILLRMTGLFSSSFLSGNTATTTVSRDDNETAMMMMNRCQELFLLEQSLNESLLLQVPLSSSSSLIVSSSNDTNTSNETLPRFTEDNINITTSPNIIPHERYCSSQILGEKQVWNHYKKVLSYSIFGPIINNTNNNTSNTTADAVPDWVVHGIERNILDAQRYYPDWIVRVYTFDLPQSLQDKWLVHNASIFHNVEVVPCLTNSPLTKSNARQMLSRILAYDDPKVWYTLVRDADSRLSLREAAAVNEFIGASMAVDNLKPHVDLSVDATISSHENFDPLSKDGIYFHVMRDHRAHIVPIMGGMFGMKRGLLPAAMPSSPLSMVQLVDKALQENPFSLGGCCGEDQSFLSRYLWPQVKKVTLDHDMKPRRCQGYGAAHCREFPLGPRDESIDYFVGSGFKDKDEQTKQWHTKRKRHVCTIQCSLANETDEGEIKVRRF